jgi:hypothetical protein
VSLQFSTAQAVSWIMIWLTDWSLMRH